MLRYTALDILQVTGVQAARIKTVAEKGPLDPLDTLETMRRWEPSDLLAGRYVTGGSLLGAYCTILRARYLSERWPYYNPPSLEEWKAQYLSQTSPMRSVGFKESHKLDADVEWMLRIVIGRTFIATESGTIGLVPSDAQPGQSFSDFYACHLC